MKPIIYSEAFIKGYTPDTVVFDLPTSFSTTCDLDGNPLSSTTGPIKDSDKCYMPGNYDDKFRGPITLRNALAQSINIPAIKTLYLAGIRDSLALAKNMGITSLGNADQYGLTLVLGGGEISLLEMTSAYGTFANDGTHVAYRPVLQVFDSKGIEVKLPSQKQSQVLPVEVARSISDILSDNVARTPGYGANSVLYFPTRDVAVKTGTTNDSRDAWTIGYTPNLVIGVWAGNNDNSPMVKKVAGQIVAPIWSSIMKQGLATVPDERFTPPTPVDPSTLKPVMKGIWQGGQTYTIDTVSGKLATDLTPLATRKEVPVTSVHSILYWVSKADPRGPAPANPSDDPQFDRWEAPVRKWAQENGYLDQTSAVIPTQTDNIHTSADSFKVAVQIMDGGRTYGLSDTVSINVGSAGRYSLAKANLYVNDLYVGSIDTYPFTFKFVPKDISNIKERNAFRVVATDSVFNQSESRGEFSVALDN